MSRKDRNNFIISSKFTSILNLEFIQIQQNQDKNIAYKVYLLELKRKTNYISLVKHFEDIIIEQGLIFIYFITILILHITSISY